jgi:adenine-specific DNA-methyltransferase
VKLAPSEQKLRGGYYTPAPIADFLASWAITHASCRVLEPSCGDGAILSSVVQQLQRLNGTNHSARPDIVGIEIDRDEAAKASKRLGSSGLPGTISQEDFFGYALSLAPQGPLFQNATTNSSAFDAIVGNPPFIRYQSFPEQYRQRAFAIMEQQGLHPNRLTNSWVPFLVASCTLLGPEGRLAMVIPAELLQVNYAAEIRRFLSDYFQRITIVTFRNLVFDTKQQEVVLLLAEKAAPDSHGIRVIEVEDASALVALTPDAAVNRPERLDHSTDKWTQYFLSQRQIDLLRRLRKHPELTRLGELVDVDVGVVTGDNDYFALSLAEAASHGVQDHTKPLVSRSAQLAGISYSKREWRQHLASQQRVLLFAPPDADVKHLPQSVRRYLEHGLTIGTHEGYKCRIRRRWFIVPSQWVPDAFFTRQVHAFPRLVLNRANATATDTLHRVRLINGANSTDIASAFVNSLTFAFSEVAGRSYGGGVLTVEPTEVESLPIPLQVAPRLDFAEIDNLLRTGQVDACLDLADRVLLIDGLGLSRQDVHQLRLAYRQLRDRRINRRR